MLKKQTNQTEKKKKIKPVGNICFHSANVKLFTENKQKKRDHKRQEPLRSADTFVWLI